MKKIYTSKSGIIGPCGPCSFINLTGIKGGINVEKNLAKIGRLKPFHVSGYSAFLVWGEKYNFDLVAYTTSKNLNKKMINLMCYYEKVPKEKKSIYQKQVENLIKKRNNHFRNKIKLIRKPINKIEESLNREYKIAVLVSDYYLQKPRKPVPHWIVLYNKKKGLYYFMDSAKKDGLTKLSKKQLLHSWELNKKVGFYPQFVVFQSRF